MSKPSAGIAESPIPGKSGAITLNLSASSGHRFGRNVFDLLTHPATKNLNKMCHQSRNVFAADPQRWQDNREHVQTIVEVAAKCVPLNHVGQLSVGATHDPTPH